jgi:beta-phosphoglucomutase-like phosphatase (HAD superfamily)
MNGRSLASVARKAIVSRISEAAVIHIIDDDESMLRRFTVFCARPRPDRRRINLTVYAAQHLITAPDRCLVIEDSPAGIDAELHQASFRDAVLSAYGGRCAISHLPEPRLLDAAHIVMDADEQLGQPVVSNGLPSTMLPSMPI